MRRAIYRPVPPERRLRGGVGSGGGGGGGGGGTPSDVTVRSRLMCYGLQHLMNGSSTSTSSGDVVRASKFGHYIFGLYGGISNASAKNIVTLVKTLNPSIVMLHYGIPKETKVPGTSGYNAADRTHGDYFYNVARYATSTVSAGSTTSIQDTSQNWRTNCWAGALVRMMSGPAAGNTATIASNSADTLTFTTDPLTTAPGVGSTYRIEGLHTDLAGGWWQRRVDRTTLQWNTSFGAWDMEDTSAGKTWKGDIWSEIYAEAMVDTFSGVDNADGWFLDNLQLLGGNADYLANGTNVSPATAATQVRTSQRRGVNRLRLRTPSRIIAGNTHTLGSNFGAAGTPMDQGLDGCMMENACGDDTTWSMDGGGTSSLINQPGAPQLMTNYQNCIDRSRGGKHVYFQAIARFNTSACRIVRYGLAAALMKDQGLFGLSYRGGADGTLGLRANSADNIFDEYLQDLGDPIDPPQTGPAPGQNGAWLRRFEKGAAVWNPRGNAAAAVNVPGYGRIGQNDRLVTSGTPQDAVANNGGSGAFTLQGNDGRFLVARPF